ncbi:MAG: HD domain-containing phosphohydrolase [Thermodesulfobacteriota bacterium]
MQTSNTEKFVPISRDEVLAGVSTLTFDLYSINLDKGILDPEVLCRRGTTVQDVGNTLAERVLDKLFVRKQALQDFYDHMEESLGSIIENPRLPTKKKSEIIYTCAANVMQDVYNDPRSGENIARSRAVSDNIIKFTLSDPSSIPTLLSLSSHNYYTFTHCVNVAVFGIGLWQFIGLGSPDDLREFALGSILHDVGKTSVDDGILNKPGKLTNEEFEIIKSHPRKGHELMKDEVSDAALDIILHHHEKYDGTGYPDKLEGGDISDNAKVAIIADVYDALTTNRPYGDARDPFQAMLLMKEKMVGHFEQEKFISFVKFLSNTPS